MGETFNVDEGYWQALLQDAEANVPDESIERNGTADRANGSSAARPIDQLWEAARKACDCDDVLEVQVTGYNRGGVLVDWSGLHGFVPASHILNMPNVTDDAQRRAEFEKRVGQSVKGKIIELDRAHGRFVLSERLAYNDRTRVELLLADLQPGQRRCGVVTTVCDFGAFIDLGGIEGLAHISEISWGRINHPSDVLHSGQNVEVHVMTVDREQRRVALSLKRLCPDPWVTVPQRYQLQQMVEGTVTTVVDFGAFVRLEEGVEGLIHISELAEGNFLHPRNVVHEHDIVRVRVLSVDVAHRRLGLSLRQVQNGNGAVTAPEEMMITSEDQS
ncbi:MAG TPA: S1 RNA-binding domain-containing protein [Anaerolineae bacterium]|nr:S1 RNA-binding domain-containing protein [Anaerolineae bacterium]